MTEKHHIINMHVDNEPGVLTRVTGLIRREGWNIIDLTVAETADPSRSRLTVGVMCAVGFLPHVLNRLGKMTCVRDIGVCAPEQCRELGVVSIHDAKEGDRAAIESIASRFGARLLRDGGSETRYELTGPLGEVDAFLAALEPYGRVRVARSGAVALVEREGSDSHAEEG